MIELRCINTATGHSEVIHVWSEDDAIKIANAFCDYMCEQDKSTDHFYDIWLTEDS